MSHATAKKTNFVAKSGGPKPTEKNTVKPKGKEWKKTNSVAKTGGFKPNERNTFRQKGKEWKKKNFGAKTGGSKPTDKYTVRQKRKEWQKAKYIKKKPLPPKNTQNANEKPIILPREPQEFSANWKKLQEVCESLQFAFVYCCHV